ncbi:hypothetical protein HWQ46_17985 [Shewanella sp. D64]|uniref:S41 family peptidase n=1 Tax=unclassified Shewanella TaxID=196818 RepID=UPI0022BA239E|nr:MULTISPECIES: S41 family peptidase [unclassified Shewanella]MEC4727438.1 hypothetical protein [Shewanella sp. D64]MEC4739593.1 hypothetical protein [Shewanella sp. E94]WBJ96025.1 hypothetical protein HWQ47_02510 [Shewanella sp. MTB7]
MKYGKYFIYLLLTLFFSTTDLLADSSDLLLTKDTEWRYWASTETVAEGWMAPEFNDSLWPVGKPGFGYGDEDDQTILSDMRGQYSKVYLRTGIELTEKQASNVYRLRVFIDDAAKVYLNGELIEAFNYHRGKAVGLADAKLFQSRISLKRGTNLLAIEGDNHALNSSDLSLEPWLTDDNLPTASFLRMRNEIRLSRVQALEDLRSLQYLLVDKAAYLTLRNDDVISQLESVAQTFPTELSNIKLLERINPVLNSMGDCHYSSSISPYSIEVNRNLPFRLADSDLGVVALDKEGDNLLRQDAPLLMSIDGIPLDKLLMIAASMSKDCSLQGKRRKAISNLAAYYPLIRARFDFPEAELINIGLGDGDKIITEVKVRKSARPLRVKRIALGKSRYLSHGVAYLRIKKMDKSLLAGIIAKMTEYQNSSGLIIDIRGNGGGSYHISDALFGYFLPPGQAAKVVNVRAYKLSPDFKPGMLDYRNAYLIGSGPRSDDEHAVVNRFATQFSPVWSGSESLGKHFSQLHYKLLGRSKAVSQYYYSKPVVLLTDAGSGSAADGFASFWQQLDNVTLIGEPSYGKSGSSRRYTLPNSKLKLRFSAALSFRDNGQLIEGRGIEVDIDKRPTINDITSGSDSVLDYAVKYLHQLGSS